MIKIVGDINFADDFFDTGFGVGSRINSGNDPFQYLSRNTDDFWIGNFECVCSNISNKCGIYAKQFIINPSLLSSIVHLDVYGVAHSLSCEECRLFQERWRDELVCSIQC